MSFVKRIHSFGLLVIALALVLAACATPGAAPQESPVPAVTEDLPLVTEPPATEAPVVTEAPAPENETGDLRPVEVQDVQVEIGEGSPRPVDVVVSGTWPDLCAQLAQVNQRIEGTRFEIDLLATPADPSCPPDNLGLPFRIAIPLNFVELPGGTYSFVVNGVETAIAWDFMPASGGIPPDTQPGELRPLPVGAVTVDVGVGSPIPVEVRVESEWPDPCANLAEVRQSVSGNNVEITLLATPTEAGCPPANQGLPFNFSLPLNMVEMELGEYAVTVNGVATSFEWTATPGEPEVVDQPAVPATIAYIGSDGNLWVIENGGEPRQVTQDGTPLVYSEMPVTGIVSYNIPKVSTDGRFVAARRDSGTPVEWGMQYEIVLWVVDLSNGESRLVYEKTPAGFDWKPGTHLIAYGLGVEQEYFTTRGGQPDPDLATGIVGFDMDSGETSELVQPERGLALFTPTWSPDGRYLGFDELVYMEGRGPFAYYDFESGQYVPWEDPLGTYDFSPDGSQIAYDRMTYTASGEERIFTQPISGGEETQFSPEIAGAYAYLPVYSPQGERIAYLAALGGPDDHNQHLYVQDLAGGEPIDLGLYESVWSLSWTPDGERLVFHAGPYGAQQVLMVSAADGTVTILADGNSPDVSR
jgi:Tol biopolymer transport system component